MTLPRRLLGLAVKAAASVLAVVLAVVLTDTLAKSVDPDLKPTRFDVIRGAQIYRSRCMVCHGLEEWEGKDGNLGRLGPGLRDIRAQAATRKPGMSAVEYIFESIMDPAAFRAPAPTNSMMPMNLTADLSDDDTRDLVAQVANLGARADDEIAALAIERQAIALPQRVELRRDVMELAERIFREKCLDCHAAHNEPEYLVYAPAVFRVGFPTDRSLEDAIMHAGPSPAERYRLSSLALADGSERIGYIVERNADALAIMSMRPEDRGTISRVKLSDIRSNADGSPMIADADLRRMVEQVSTPLTPIEVDALLALIRALN